MTKPGTSAEGKKSKEKALKMDSFSGAAIGKETQVLVAATVSQQ